MNIAVFDARRSRDPTGTSGIRSRFRMDAQRRIADMRAIVRAAVVDHDVLGLGLASGNIDPTAPLAGTFALASQPLGAFGNWFTQVAYAAFVGRDGGWVTAHVREATMAGNARAQREVRNLVPVAIDFTRSDMIASLAAQELTGIADATVQQTVRAAHDAVLAHWSPRVLFRAMSERFDKITRIRTNALVNQIVIKAFNDAKLEVYGAAGIARVGVIPEMQPAPRAHDHAMRDAPVITPYKIIKGVKTVAKIAKARGVSVTKMAKLVTQATKWKKAVEAATGAGDLVGVLTAEDDLVCDDCDEISLSGPYTLYEAVGLIPAHPNCRCEFVPESDERFAEIEQGDAR
jgi:hypothetical protein